MTGSLMSLLALGFVLGLKHALDADHLAAVSTMAAERRSLFVSSMVGALWGVGHTISLVIAGMFVILLHLEIGERASRALDFCVALMLIALGASALLKLARGGRVHLHPHEHDGYWHVHPHLHDTHGIDAPHTHHGFKIGARPVLVGLVHGMAGGAALTLAVLATIPSPLVGFVYIAVFGMGSIGGMMIMSTLLAIPAKLTTARFGRANVIVCGVAGAFSLCLGLFMAYDIGFVNHLLR